MLESNPVLLLPQRYSFWNFADLEFSWFTTALASAVSILIFMGLKRRQKAVGRSLALDRARKELKKSERRFRDIFEKTAIGMAEVGLNGQFLRVNPQLCEITGYSPQELVQKNFSDITHPDDLNKDWELLNSVLAGRIPDYSLEKRYFRASGTVIWVKIRVSLVTTEQGSPNYFVVSIDDITEQQRSKEDLQRTEVALREALSTRDEFLSIASHELKTPLTSLKLQLQMANRLISPDLEIPHFDLEKLLRMVETSLFQVERLQKLIDDLLDVSYIRAGKLQFHFEEIHLSELVASALERHLAQLAEARCELDVDIQKNIVTVCDQFRIEQVLTNLLTNASKYGAGKPVRVQLRKNDRRIQLLVQDSGIGIPKDKQQKIFERFERAVGHSRISGLGLGLYICTEIVQAHAGKIWVESEFGFGSKFIVEIPERT